MVALGVSSGDLVTASGCFLVGMGFDFSNAGFRSSFMLRTSAAFPKAFLLTLRVGSFLSFCCSSVNVLALSCRYLNELRFLDSMF